MPDALGARRDHHDAARVALERLRRFGGERLAREMTAMFAELAAERLAAAGDALARGDRGALTHAAHALKPTCGQMGAAVGERLCRELEERAATADHAALARLVERLAGECDAHRAALERELAAGGDA